MKVSEFLSVAKDTQWFCIKKTGETVSDEEELVDRIELEASEFSECNIEEVDFILDLQRSCSYTIDVVPVLFIVSECDKFIDEYLNS
jgi:hypothetical protein